MESPTRWAVTQLKTESVQFRWTIQNFSWFLLEPGEYLDSPCFSRDENSPVWYLKLFPFGEDNNQYISLYLYLKSCESANEVISKATLAIIDVEGEKKHIEELNLDKYTVDNGWGMGLLKREELLQDETLLPKDGLTLHAEVKYSVGKKDSCLCDHESWLVSWNIGASLWASRELLSDVVISVKEKEFPSHQAILASASPVFAAMFSHDTLEKTEQRVTIDDIEPEIIHHFLEFIYTGFLPTFDDTKIIEKLLVAADKYQIDKLKNACENVLMEKITISNVVHCLLLSYWHNLIQLKSAAIFFIKANSGRILQNNASWTEVIVTYPQLMSDVLKIVCK